MTVMRESERVYSSGFAGRMRTLLSGVICAALFGFVIAKVVIYDGMRIHDQRILVGCFVLVFVIVNGFALSKVLVTGPVRFVTTPSTVQLYRGGRLRDTWPRATTKFFPSTVTRTPRRYGLPTVTTRTVIATTAAERVETVCTWFDGDEFDALAEDLRPTASAYAAPSRNEPGGTSGSYGLGRARSPFRQLGILVTAICCLLALSFGSTAVMAREYTLLAVVAIASLVLLALVVAPIWLSLRRDRSIPHSISITPSTLQFDDRAFALAELGSITATPPSYTGRMRTVILTTSSGQQTKVLLGLTDRSRWSPAPFPDYDDFVKTLVRATAHRPGLFALAVAVA